VVRSRFVSGKYMATCDSSPQKYIRKCCRTSYCSASCTANLFISAQGKWFRKALTLTMDDFRYPKRRKPHLCFSCMDTAYVREKPNAQNSLIRLSSCILGIPETFGEFKTCECLWYWWIDEFACWHTLPPTIEIMPPKYSQNIRHSGMVFQNIESHCFQENSFEIFDQVSSPLIINIPSQSHISHPTIFLNFK